MSLSHTYTQRPTFKRLHTGCFSLGVMALPGWLLVTLLDGRQVCHLGSAQVMFQMPRPHRCSTTDFGSELLLWWPVQSSHLLWCLHAVLKCTALWLEISRVHICPTEYIIPTNQYYPEVCIFVFINGMLRAHIAESCTTCESNSLCSEAPLQHRWSIVI